MFRRIVARILALVLLLQVLPPGALVPAVAHADDTAPPFTAPTMPCQAPVVLIPDLGFSSLKANGSSLYDGQTANWAALTDPNTFGSATASFLVKAGNHSPYDALITDLHRHGYSEQAGNLVLLGYDWRLDPSDAFQQYLAPVLQQLSQRFPCSQGAVIIGHGLGGLVAAQESSYGDPTVRAVIDADVPIMGVGSVWTALRQGGDAGYYLPGLNGQNPWKQWGVTAALLPRPTDQSLRQGANGRFTPWADQAAAQAAVGAALSDNPYVSGLYQVASGANPLSGTSRVSYLLAAFDPALANTASGGGSQVPGDGLVSLFSALNGGDTGALSHVAATAYIAPAGTSVPGHLVPFGAGTGQSGQLVLPTDGDQAADHWTLLGQASVRQAILGYLDQEAKEDRNLRPVDPEFGGIPSGDSETHVYSGRGAWSADARIVLPATTAANQWFPLAGARWVGNPSASPLTLNYDFTLPRAPTGAGLYIGGRGTPSISLNGNGLSPEAGSDPTLHTTYLRLDTGLFKTGANRLTLTLPPGAAAELHLDVQHPGGADIALTNLAWVGQDAGANPTWDTAQEGIMAVRLQDRLWTMDGQGGRLHLQARLSPDEQYDVKVSPDGRRAAVQGLNGVYIVRLDVPGDPGELIWSPSLPTGYPILSNAGIYQVLGGDGSPRVLGWTPGGNGIVVQDNAYQIWQVPVYTPGPARPIQVSPPGYRGASQPALMPDGEVVDVQKLSDGTRHLVALCGDGLVPLDQNRPWLESSLGTPSPGGTRFFGSQAGLASAGSMLWSITGAGDQQYQPPAPLANANFLGWTADGEGLLFAADGKIQAVDVQSGAILTTYPLPEDARSLGSDGFGMGGGVHATSAMTPLCGGQQVDVPAGYVGTVPPPLSGDWTPGKVLTGRVGSATVNVDGVSQTLPRPLRLVQVGAPAAAEVRGPAQLFALLGASLTNSGATLSVPGRSLNLGMDGAGISDMDQFGVTWEAEPAAGQLRSDQLDFPLQQITQVLGLAYDFDPATGQVRIYHRASGTSLGHEIRLQWNSRSYRLDGKAGTLDIPSLGVSGGNLWVSSEAFRLLLGDAFQLQTSDGSPGYGSVWRTQTLATWQGRHSRGETWHDGAVTVPVRLSALETAFALGLDFRRDMKSGELVISTPGYRGPDLPLPWVADDTGSGVSTGSDPGAISACTGNAGTAAVSAGAQTGAGKVIKLQVNSAAASVNGTPTTLDVPAQLVEGHTMVPARFVAESLGAQVAWDGTDRKITITSPDRTIVLWVDQPGALVGDKAVPLDAPPVVVGGRTLVPLRFIVENLGAQLQWNGMNQPMVITFRGGEGAAAGNDAMPTATFSPVSSATGPFPLVSATFDQPMNEASVTAALHLCDDHGRVAGGAKYDPDARAVYFLPDQPLHYGITYTASVDASAVSAAGTPLGHALTWRFGTGPVPSGKAVVSGVVRGQAGPISGVAVTAVGGSGQSIVTLTNSTGQYQLLLAAGQWSVRASASDQSLVSDPQFLTLATGAAQTVDLTMAPVTAGSSSAAATSIHAELVQGDQVVTLDPSALAALESPALKGQPLQAATPYGLYDPDGQGKIAVQVYPDRPTLVYLVSGDTDVAAVVVDGTRGDSFALTAADSARGLLWLGAGLLLAGQSEQAARWADIQNSTGVDSLAQVIVAQMPSLDLGLDGMNDALKKAIGDALMALPRVTAPQSRASGATSMRILLPPFAFAGSPAAVARRLLAGLPGIPGVAPGRLLADAGGSSGGTPGNYDAFASRVTPRTAQSGLTVQPAPLDPLEIDVFNAQMRYVRLRVTRVSPTRGPEGGDVLVNAVPWNILPQLPSAVGGGSNDPSASVQITPDYKETTHYQVDLRGPAHDDLLPDLNDPIYTDAVIRTLAEYIVNPMISMLPAEALGGALAKTITDAGVNISSSAVASPDFRAAVASGKPEYVAQEVMNVIDNYVTKAFNDEAYNPDQAHDPLVRLATKQQGVRGGVWMHHTLEKSGILDAIGQLKESLASAPMLVGALLALQTDQSRVDWQVAVTPLGRRLQLTPEAVNVVPGGTAAFKPSLLLVNGQQTGLPAGGQLTWGIEGGPGGVTLQDGQVTVDPDAPPGMTLVRATLTFPGDVGGEPLTATAAVGVPQLVLAVSPGGVVLPTGGSQRFRAFLFDQETAPVNTDWTLVENRTGGSISADGTYTAGRTPGGDVIQVTYRRPRGKALTATIAVQAIDPWQLNTVRAGLKEGQQYQFRLQKYDSGSGSWFDSDAGQWSITSNQSGGSIDPSSGWYTAGSQPGFDWLQVQFTDDFGHNRTLQAVVQVLGPQPNGAHLCPPSPVNWAEYVWIDNHCELFVPK